MTDSTTAQPARASRARKERPTSVVEVEIPSSLDPDVLVVSVNVPLRAERGAPTLPGFTLDGVPADVVALSHDATGRPTLVRVAAPISLVGRKAGAFARLVLQPTGEEHDVGAPEIEIAPLDLVVTIRTPEGFFHARPFQDIRRGEMETGTASSTWTSSATIEHGETRGIVVASLELRADGFAVVDLLLANAIQPVEVTARRGGDFCYHSCEIELAGSSAVLPLPRAGEKVLPSRREGGGAIVRLLEDGPAHLWPRMLGTLRRIVLAPPRAGAAALVRAGEIGRFYGLGFVIEGPNSWIECPSHGPEGGILAPWTDSLDLWGTARGQAAARKILDDEIAGIQGPRQGGAAIGAFAVRQFGLFHPIGQKQEGEPGGWKIRPVGTFALDRRLVLERWLELEHGIDRMRCLHFEPRSGKPTTAYQWAAKHGGRVPFAFKNHGPDRFPWLAFPNVNGSTAFVSNVSQGRMLPHDDGELLTVQDQDDQHEIRDVEPPETIARFTGSGMALAILELLAANGELARHTFPSPEGDATLAKMLADDRKEPRAGSTNAGRALAWDLRAIAAYAEFAPTSWREERMLWARTLATWTILARGRHGLLGDDVPGGHTSQVAIEQGAPAGFRYVQTFEEAYLASSLEKLAVLLVAGAAADRDLRTMLEGILDSAEALWSVHFPSTGTVSRFVAVGPDSGGTFELTRERCSPDSERTWIWGLLATAVRISRRLGRDPRPALERMLRAGRGDGEELLAPEAFVRAAQGLEREPWHGSAYYSALAWGEAWRVRPAAAQPPTTGGA